MEESNEINNSFFSDKEEDSISYIDDEEKNIIDLPFMNDPNANNDNEIKLGSRILCPDKRCFLNSIILINPITFEVNSNCGKHENKMDIINYIEDSGLSKEEKEICNECQKKYKLLKENKINLYKCLCGNNVCENCKKNHSKKNSEKSHNMVNFNEKDYICCCSKKGQKYEFYCYDCNENFCSQCKDKKHNNHEIIEFFNICQIKKEYIKQLKEKIEKQKKNIQVFNNIIDKWFELVKIILNEYKKKLNLYVEINERIIDLYDPNKISYQIIKNIEYINFDFEDFVKNLMNSKYNFELQNKYIFDFLKDKMNKYAKQNLNKKEILNNIDENKCKYIKDINGVIHNICELNKQGLLIINFINERNNNEELYFYKKINDNYNFNDIYFNFNESDEIIGLTGLRSGNLLMLQKKKFQIFQITGQEKEKKTIQIHKIYNNNIFKQIIELSNGYLVSVTLCPKNKTEINFWKKNLINGIYEIRNKNKEMTTEVISIIEINKYQIIILSSDKRIILVDSNTCEEKNYGILKNVDLGFFKKMLKIDEDRIILHFKKKFVLLIRISTFQCNKLNEDFSYLCSTFNDSKIFLASSKQNRNYGLYLIKCDLIDNEIKSQKFSENIHNHIINYIFQLSNGKIITSSLDKVTKIWIPNLKPIETS